MLAIISVILPAAIIVIAGYVAGKRVLDAAGVKALSDLVYFLFLPCLLFRSMATASFGGSDAKLLATYYGASLLWFFAVALFLKLRKSAATPAAIVFALGAVFSNTVQLGIPIIKLAFGDDGLKMHLSIIAMHTLVLLTVGTIWLELSQAHAGDDAPPLSETIGPVIKSAVLHPVILPIVAGLLWSAAALPLPGWIDQPLGFLASAAGPIMLVLMGAQLSTMRLAEHLRDAFTLSVLKNFAHPAIVALVSWAVGLPPLAMAVAVTCASLPIGNNVFMFAQRYRTQENTITAATAVSSLAAIASLTLALALVPRP
ncbi:AEC family transporter [Casimicrobium huifangae]|jgi:predicted permease|uniref:AEC family transporter n=1 Tax=Casimicrobium huifangae TaxID=2591109 RepID=UPI002BEB0054|nr:AEC family transporter [Casimicrobium huifangae]